MVWLAGIGLVLGALYGLFLGLLWAVAQLRWLDPDNPWLEELEGKET